MHGSRYRGCRAGHAGRSGPISLGKFKFLNSHCKTIENRPRAVTSHTPQWQKNKFAVIRSQGDINRLNYI